MMTKLCYLLNFIMTHICIVNMKSLILHKRHQMNYQLFHHPVQLTTENLAFLLHDVN